MILRSLDSIGEKERNENTEKVNCGCRKLTKMKEELRKKEKWGLKHRKKVR